MRVLTPHLSPFSLATGTEGVWGAHYCEHYGAFFCSFYVMLGDKSFDVELYKNGKTLPLPMLERCLSVWTLNISKHLHISNRVGAGAPICFPYMPLV